MTFSLSPEREALLDGIVARYPTKRASCIPALQLCQEQQGHIDDDAIAWVAQKLELSGAMVKGVVTFYTLFQQKKVAPNVIWVCRTLSCELAGARGIQAHLEERLGCHAGETSKDGQFTLLKAECLAACGYGPMIQMNDEFFENLTAEKVDELLEKHRGARDALPAGDPGAWMCGPRPGGSQP